VCGGAGEVARVGGTVGVDSGKDGIAWAAALAGPDGKGRRDYG
jgi:hypothetical protein